MSEDIIWAQKYRPRTVSETILPNDLKKVLQGFVDEKKIPNLILSGKSGVGKTTAAKAMLDEIGADYMIINGSLKGNIDTLRVEISNFASTVSFAGGRKYVILDEADYLNPQSTQPALRNFMEQYSKNCGFILTCNFKNRIIDPLHSRCGVIDFKIPKSESHEISFQFFKRVITILENENVEFDKKVLAEFVHSYSPDWRRCLNELQRYSKIGKIDAGILSSKGDENFNELMGYIRDKNFNSMRKWVANNQDIDSDTLFSKMYDILNTEASNPHNAAEGIIILAEYQFKEAFVANSEINRVAALTNIMASVNWK